MSTHRPGSPLPASTAAAWAGRQYHARTGRFLAIFHGAADEAGKAGLTEQQKLVTAQGVEDFTDAMIGYTIVEADSHDEAVQIFSRHPHLGLFAGNSIAVLECPAPPG